MGLVPLATFSSFLCFHQCNVKSNPRHTARCNLTTAPYSLFWEIKEINEVGRREDIMGKSQTKMPDPFSACGVGPWNSLDPQWACSYFNYALSRHAAK